MTDKIILTYEEKIDNKYIIKTPSYAFGDVLLRYMSCVILNDNGIKCFFNPSSEYYKDILDNSFLCYDNNIIKSNKIISSEYWPHGNYGGKLDGSDILKKFVKNKNILDILIDDFKNKFNIEKNIINSKNYIPVNYYDMPEIPIVDIVLNTHCSKWGKLKYWPYFSELKKELDKLKISYIDLDEKNIKGIECLNYVKKCKLYIGLETGMSHYVSQFANGKTLIIQSGFVDFNFWCFYNYDHIEFNLPCSNCYDLNCKDNNICMKNITVETILDYIVKKMKINEFFGIEKIRNNKIISKKVINLVGKEKINTINKNSNMFNLDVFRMIEMPTINQCTRKCSWCKWGNLENNKEEYSLMSDENINIIIKELSSINYDGCINWYLLNEPLLDTRIFDIITETKNKIPNAFIHITTNGDLLTQEFVDKFLNAGVDNLEVSIYDDNTLNKCINFNGNQKLFLLERRKSAFIKDNKGGKVLNMKKKECVLSCRNPFLRMCLLISGHIIICNGDFFGDEVIGHIKDGLLNVWYNSKLLNYYRFELLKKNRKNLKLCRYCNIDGSSCPLTSMGYSNPKQIIKIL